MPYAGKFPALTAPCPLCAGGAIVFGERAKHADCPACSRRVSRTALAAVANNPRLCRACGGVYYSAFGHGSCPPPPGGSLPALQVIRLFGQLITKNPWYLERLIWHGRLERHLAGDSHALADFLGVDD